MFYLLLFLLPFLQAEPPRIDGGKDNLRLELRFSFYVSGAFKKDLEDAINSGMPTSFTYVVKLYSEEEHVV